MNKITTIIAMACALILSACADVNDINEKLPHQKGIYAVIPNVEFEESEEETTRSSLFWAPATPNDWQGQTGKLDFAWQSTDALQVFSQDNNNSYMNYVFKSGENTGSAYFDSANFDLKKGKTYYGFVPFQATPEIDDRDITFTYSGQTQVGNGNTDHLGAFDFMAACANVSKEGFANFNFKRLSTPVRIRIADVEGKSFKSLEIRRTDNGVMQYERHLDLTDDDCTLEGEYDPVLTYDNDGCTNDSYVLALDSIGPDGEHKNHITVGSKTGSLLVLYMMMPATKEFMSCPLYGILTENDVAETKHFFSINATEFKPNILKQYAKYVTKGDKLSLTVNVEKNWVYGNTKNDTRAAGDPGTEDVLTKPDHLYVYVCKDNTYLSTKSETVTPGEWNDVGAQWAYNKAIEIDLNGNPTTNVRAYVIASVGEITMETSPADLTGQSYTVVEDMLLTSTYTESLLKNVYASSGIYTKSSSAPMIGVTLNHIAAKLDVQWNNVTSTALTGSVSIDNLPASGIKLFKPTETTGSGTWSPSPARTITTGTQWNGREVFYVPQMQNKQYTITTGTGHQKVVTFDAPTTGYKTSHLKANITVNTVAP